ncbi:MAG: ABC transporter ATP-binding protein [Proteobacteria bacterium]|nr:ABC transporter ATP-binding protein [Pseudomonadota bacterium]
MSEVILSVNELAVTFRGEGKKRLTAVDNVSFDLKRGGSLGIVGESGCGKSVTALSLMRLLPKPAGDIARGSIVLSDTEGNAVDLVKYPQKKLHKIRGKRVAMIFQDPSSSLNPVHKIGKQLMEVYKLHFPKMSYEQRHREAVDLLRRVDIPSPERRMLDFPHNLSGGMKQRVVIALALACKPEVLIADEPTTALDVTVQEQILSLIKGLQRETGMSLLLITHDVGVVAEMCDDVVVMYAGRVAEKGAIRDIIDNPQHPYTKGLLTSIPSLSSAPKARLSTIEGSVPSLYDMPQGCRFANRCDLAEQRCEQQPALGRLGDGRYVACHKVAHQVVREEAHGSS